MSKKNKPYLNGTHGSTAEVKDPIQLVPSVTNEYATAPSAPVSVDTNEKEQDMISVAKNKKEVMKREANNEQVLAARLQHYMQQLAAERKNSALLAARVAALEEMIVQKEAAEFCKGYDLKVGEKLEKGEDGHWYLTEGE